MVLILATEDPTLLRFLQRFCAVAGLECRAFSDVRAFSSGPGVAASAILVCDAHLGGGLGWKVCRDLKRAQPGLGVVLMTGDPGDLPLEAKGLGPVLVKPFLIAELLVALRAASRASQGGPLGR